MPEKISWNLNVDVQGGPKLPQSGSVLVDFVDKGSVTLEAGASDREVQLQPGTSAGQVQFLVISSDRYNENLNYKVNDESEVYMLDGPHLLVGKGAVGLLAAAPTKLLFSNGMAQSATVQILIGRDATP